MIFTCKILTLKTLKTLLTLKKVYEKMDRNEINWILECCLLSLDDVSKKEMVEMGCPEDLAIAGINLGSLLFQKERNILNV